MTYFASLPTERPHYEWPFVDDSLDAALRRQVRRSLSDRDANGVVGEFEDAFCEFVGSTYAVSFSSGTGALHALAATMMEPGKAIIAPAYTFFATATPFAYEGVDIVFADADEHGNVSAASLEAAWTPQVGAVIVTHMWGMPCEMASIVEFCRVHSLLLFEDCSHAHFGTVAGRRVGTHGDAGVFSTNQKAITSGEGGVLVTDRVDIRDAALLFAHYNKRCLTEVSVGHPDYDMATTGYGLKYRMHTLSAAVGVHQLAKAGDIEKRRRDNLQQIADALEPFPMLSLLTPSEPDLHGLYVAGLRFAPEHSRLSREEFVTAAVRAGASELDIPGSTKDISGEPLFRRGSPRHPAVPATGHASLGCQAFADSFLKLPLWGYPGDAAYVDAYCATLVDLCRVASV